MTAAAISTGRRVSFVPSLGTIRGQPITSCPPCTYSFASPHEAIVLGEISARFFFESGEDYIEEPTIRVLDVNRNILGNCAFPGERWESSLRAPGVNLACAVTGEPASVTLTFYGASGAPYSQEVPLR